MLSILSIRKSGSRIILPEHLSRTLRVKNIDPKTFKVQGKRPVIVKAFEPGYLTRDRIVGINRKDGKAYIRFYDFNNDPVNFNILIIAEKESAPNLVIMTKPEKCT